MWVHQIASCSMMRIRCEQQPSQPHRTPAGLIFGSQQYPANAQIEDRVLQATQIGSSLLVGVLDGHGGWQVAEKLRTSLPRHIMRIADQEKKDDVILSQSFLAADEEIKTSMTEAYKLGFSRLAKVGACGLAVLIDSENITVANAGDCKGLLCRKNLPIPISKQQNANDLDEQIRLRALHPGEDDVVKCKKEWRESVRSGLFSTVEVPKYSGCYVKGLLQPTRSFGDFYLKDIQFATDFDRQRTFVAPHIPSSFPYLTVEPEISIFKRNIDDKFLVLATDGLWDELNDEEVIVIVTKALKDGADPPGIANILIEGALKKAALSSGIRLEEMKRLPQGSSRRSLHDDISVVVVIF